MQQLGPDDDDQAARLTSRLIAANPTRRAAQVLHSTATMADLTQPAVQEAVQLLHPALPADAALPRLPADAEQLILQDGEDIVHSMQHSLTDRTVKRAALKIDQQRVQQLRPRAHAAQAVRHT